ncbi:glycoside hydrolase family 2 protein [Parapedobacter sp. 10938]|uniref:glycoside hydrolase family 2 protein n=1 Tax=Parapedobacter flavus TaxID=3110225 RepID=UPI002DB636F5|nr:sugar-binding domain-containing protein [Parapedobacter sp. 10938]MEC3880117.1 sugar-binding domain-containing protein [Parapedobacter sp. 10938]
MKRLFTAVLLACLFSIGHAQTSPLNPAAMMTPWGEQVTPQNAWRAYPRPQMERADWMSLNGLWDYAIQAKGASKPSQYDGQILVPFSVESSLSGVAKSVRPDQALWYHTRFTVPADWSGKRLLLHFEAVDWEATVWLNGKKIGEHRGGSDPFAFDISRHLKKGEQELVLSVWDPTDTGTQARGKQVLNPRGIWYTPVTGIWQSVWLEPVEKTHIESVLPVADIETNTVTLTHTLAGAKGGETVSVKVLKGGQVIAEKDHPANEPVAIAVPDAEWWTPYHPTLYQLEITLHKDKKTLDRISSYFALREIAIGKDEHGYQRLLLNNEPLFQYGTLDQGWWPDGLLTPPSEEAMRYDMEVLKEMGFNMLRKHIKVEPSRYYYYADSIGLLVWQDMVSGFKTAEKATQHVAADAASDWDRPQESAAQFEQEWKQIIDHLRFFPSIVVWVPFNEGWGQYETERMVKWTMQYDTTRVIDGVSGWTDRGVGHMNDAHQYPGPAMEPAEQNPGRVIVLGEFGGLGLPVKEHLWNPEMRNWGYRTYMTSDRLIKEYTQLIHNLQPMIGRGLSAAIYTQTTDVEGEVNGLITYDRRKVKVDPAWLRLLHSRLYNEPQPARAVVSDSEVQPQQLLVASENPINDAGEVNRAAFRAERGPVTLHKGDNRWGLLPFTMDEVENLQLRILAHADVKIYLNGKLVVDKFLQTKRHYDDINISEFKGYLKRGANELLVELTDVKARSLFDVGLYAF